MRNKILNQIKNGEITPREGYSLLYLPQPEKGHFITLNMQIQESRLVSGFINLLFLLPWPIGIAKLALSIVNKKKNLGIEREVINEIIDASRGIRINIENNDVRIRIKII